MTGENGTFLLKTIQTHGPGCLLGVEIGIMVSERIRLYLYGKGAFLWSCQELPEIESHDQGLLVLMDSNYRMRYDNISEPLGEMKSAIKNYFGRALIEQVHWEIISEDETAFCKSTSLCMPPITKIRNDIPTTKYVVVVAILFSCILGLYIYINFPPISFTYNRVYPLQCSR